MKPRLLPLTTLIVFLLAGLACGQQCGPNGCSNGQCPTTPTWQPQKITVSQPSTQDPYYASVCIVESVADAPRGGTRPIQGSGVLLDKDSRYGLVTTNWHIVAGAQDHGVKPIVTFPAFNTRHEAVVIAADSLWDQALLKIQSPPAPAKALRDNTKLNVGDPVSIAAFPKGQYELRQTTVSGYRRPNETSNDHLIFVGTEMLEGSSGGPIFDSDGRVAGIVARSTMENPLPAGVPRGTGGPDAHAIRWFAQTKLLGKADESDTDQTTFLAQADLAPLPPPPGYDAGDRRRRGSGPEIPEAPLAEGMASDLEALRERVGQMDDKQKRLETQLDDLEKAKDAWASGMSREDKTAWETKIQDAKDAASGWVSKYDSLSQQVTGLPSTMDAKVKEAKAKIEAAVEQTIIERVNERVQARIAAIPLWVKIVLGILGVWALAATGWLAKIHRFNKRVAARIPGKLLDRGLAALDDNVERHTEAGWNPIEQGRATVTGGQEGIQELRREFHEFRQALERSVLAKAVGSVASPIAGGLAALAKEAMDHLGTVSQVRERLEELVHGKETPPTPAPAPAVAPKPAAPSAPAPVASPPATPV